MRIFGLITLIALALAPASHAQTTLRLEPYGDGLLSLDATIGKKTGRFLFDTGEGVTMISPEMAQAAGCKTWGNLTAFRMDGDRLDAPRCENLRLKTSETVLQAPMVLVYDLMTIVGKDEPHLDGAIGLDVFDGQVITLQLASRRVVIETPTSLKARLKHAIPIPVHLVRGSEGWSLDTNIGVKTPQGTAWMELDSANKGPTVFFSEAIAPTMALNPDTREKQDVAFTIVPGVEFKGQARVFPNMVIDGNIGMQLMKDWDVTLDLKSGRGWVTSAEK